MSEEPKKEPQIIDSINNLLDTNEIKTAIIILSPQNSDEILITYRGEFFDITTITNDVAKKFISKINSLNRLREKS